jgi:1-acyl-sn-glycerol-3-phosphate acyltransferase
MSTASNKQSLRLFDWFWKLSLIIAGFAVMTAGSAVALLVAVVTLFQARDLYASYIIAPTARIALWIGGIKFVVHDKQNLGRTQTVYIANHSSTLDVFILTAMRLPNTRFFLSGHLRKKFPPLGLLGYIAGVFWTVPQIFPARRVEIFKRAERVLRRTGESVFLSPEGNKGSIGQIAPFNKGAFHLATNLSTPIVPIYLAIPTAINPGWGYNFRSGVVHIYVHPPIPTDDWKLQDLDENRLRMHRHFLELQNRYEGK